MKHGEHGEHGLGLRIREGVLFAAVGGEGVLLDLERNRYVGLSGPSALFWRRLVEGASRDDLVAEVQERVTDRARASTIVDAQIAFFKEASLLGGGAPRTAVPAVRPPRPPADRSLDFERLDRAPPSPRAVGRILVASAWTLFSTRALGAPAAFAAVQRIAAGRADCGDRALRLCRAQRWLRRLYEQGEQDCVFRSIALARALREEGIDAVICIGVKKFPFQAHAWVEIGGTVVNEDMEHVVRFVRIAEL